MPSKITYVIARLCSKFLEILMEAIIHHFENRK